MMTYPTPLSNTPALTDEATLDVALDCLLEHVELEMQGDYTQQTLFEILLRAASKHDSIEHTTQRLEGSPTGKTIHYHLDKLENMEALEHQMNQALQSRLPARIAKRKHLLAIDLHLLPYYGKPNASEQPYIYRLKPKQVRPPSLPMPPCM